MSSLFISVKDESKLDLLKASWHWRSSLVEFEFLGPTLHYMHFSAFSILVELLAGPFLAKCNVTISTCNKEITTFFLGKKR
jgi:hypothetical protein